MRPGLADCIEQIDDARKTAVIDRELSRLGIDIACLQKTRLADSGSIREAFFWQDLPQDNSRQHGVRIAVKNSLIPAIVPPTGGSERILALRLLTSTGFANVLCIYAPMLCATPELDLVINRRADIRSVLHTLSFHSADCDTDHSLVGCKVRLTAKKIHRSKTKGFPRINTCRANDPESSRCFQTTFSAKVDTSSFSATDIDSRWHHLRDVIYTSALTAFGKKDRLNADWYEAHWDEMQPAFEAKRQALLAYKHNTCVNTCDALRAARSKAQ
ncbi:unnamed protein product [Acanthosepion pharaonis]|uniref:Uncharacterized protein n=1 Tax=Acanthosepion pharaonis TaxID=158019 RepID=A0A812C4F7_ACAPH|nr:unnamed protein product [Sepia pharaonis]